MLSLGALSFAAPWALAGLALLPALWWLLRATPPSPRRVVFPPLRLLQALSSREQSAVRTPWWLLLLRLALMAALILGVARPYLDADQIPSGAGPVYLLVDNGWAAAATWPARQAAVMQTIDRAERDGRALVLAPTAADDGTDGRRVPPVLLTPSAARERANALRPQPWGTDRAGAIGAMVRAANEGGWLPGTVAWISDGLAEPAGFEAALLDRLRALGRPFVLLPKPGALPLLLRPAEHAAVGPAATLARAEEAFERTVQLRLMADDGTTLSRQTALFPGGERRVTVTAELPTELAGRLARIDVETETTAGAALLIDERSQRRAVGLLAAGESGGRPLLGGHYYLARALQPFAEVREGDLGQLLARPIAALILTDVGTLDTASARTIGRWVEQGGVLLRFAGPRLAREATADDPLLPVPLRAGDRTLGGALSWSGVARLAPPDPESPLHGLSIPPDIEIRRQVVAEPTLDSARRTWARLDDGTPLITGVRRGEGWVVLIHTTADPDWSNLPLSGLFVDLLRRIVELGAGGSGADDAAVLPALETLDGFGRLGPPPADARPIAGAAFAGTVVGPSHPPGFYGTREARRALDLGASVPDPVALAPFVQGSASRGITTATLGETAERDLRPWLLGLALLLAVADLAGSLAMRGLLRFGSGSAGRMLAVSVLAATLACTGAAAAETVVSDGTADPASLTMRLAFVRTGDAADDEVSEAGLTGLGLMVNRRTSAELGPPAGVDPETDELAFYPLLYWPLSASARPISATAARKLAAYMRAGGTIVFDSRGRDDAADSAALRDLARKLDLPPLVPVADGHVLRRSYYLIPDMPGRRGAGTVWVESAGEHVNDGVSSVVASSADWAGAWAVDRAQRPLFAVVPGGERQREQAYRAGINLVMYVLTGNYKADQVHLPAILERLGP